MHAILALNQMQKICNYCKGLFVKEVFLCQGSWQGASLPPILYAFLQLINRSTNKLLRICKKIIIVFGFFLLLSQLWTTCHYLEYRWCDSWWCQSNNRRNFQWHICQKVHLGGWVKTTRNLPLGHPFCFTKCVNWALRDCICMWKVNS